MEKRKKLCQLAVAEIDKVLETQPNDIIPLTLKARIMRKTFPLEAIQVIETIFKNDDEVLEVKAKVNAMTKEADAATRQGDHGKATRISAEIDALIATAPLFRISSSPQHLSTALLTLAEAKEAAGQYGEAHEQFIDIGK